MRAAEAVGRARIDLQGGVLDDLGGEQGRVTDRHDLVIVAVDDQGRNVELLEVFRQVRLGEGLDAVEGAFETDLHRPQPEHVLNALRHLGVWPVGAVEGGAEILVELRAVCMTPARMRSNASMGMPPGLAAVLSISGGTAPTSTALARRAVPWRPM